MRDVRALVNHSVVHARIAHADTSCARDVRNDAQHAHRACASRMRIARRAARGALNVCSMRNMRNMRSGRARPAQLRYRVSATHTLDDRSTTITNHDSSSFDHEQTSTRECARQRRAVASQAGRQPCRLLVEWIEVVPLMNGVRRFFPSATFSSSTSGLQGAGRKRSRPRQEACGSGRGTWDMGHCPTTTHTTSTVRLSAHIDGPPLRDWQ